MTLPLYLQVSGTLRTAILRGIYPVGSRLPTEEELCGRFKVSRHTIREALRQLRTDGLIASQPGGRPVVAKPAAPPPEQIEADIGEDFFDYVIATRLEVRSMETVRIDASLAQETGLSASRLWLRVDGYRVSVDSGRTTCWNSYFIDPDHAVVGQLLARHVGPLIPLLEDLFGKRITRITRAVAASAMPEEHAERFGVAPGALSLAITTCCETADGGIALVNRSLHPGATLRYAIRR